MKLSGWLATMALCANGWAYGSVPLHPDRGVALIWYGNQDNLDSRDGVVSAGQIMFMWRDFEPAPGKYRFDELDRQLREVQAKGLKTTIQINGNVHPDHVYASVPYLKGIKIRGTRDDEIGFGAPMYWHATYMKHYEKMVHALARHLGKSPFRTTILGIRQSYCAVGTEHHTIPSEYVGPEHWHCEPGVSLAAPWNREIADVYRRWAVDLYLDAFLPHEGGVPVFIRASALSEGLASERHRDLVARGQLMLFHTSTEPQPRSETKDKQYRVFLDYCKTGKTYGFMESWSMATESSDKWDWPKTGQHMTKAQFNYWSLLCNLHCGATFPAMRPEDVDVPEYRADYAFCAAYAGFLHEPEKSPGAWIAFREGDYLVGDYTFLMERVAEEDGTVPLYRVDASKVGLWARELPAGGALRLKMDDAFFKGLEPGGSMEVRVTFKDRDRAPFHVSVSGVTHAVAGESSGEWKTVALAFPVSASNEILIESSNVPLVLHMIEVRRKEAR